MENDKPYPYDDEVEQLLQSLNSEAQRTVARLIAYPQTVFDAMEAMLPAGKHGDGIDWSKAVCCSGPLPDDPHESLQQTVDRVLRDVEMLREVAQLQSDDTVSIVSDDFYSIGIECEFCYAARVLKAWLALPHAIFVLPTNLKACLYVTFARSCYTFRNDRLGKQ